MAAETGTAINPLRRRWRLIACLLIVAACIGMALAGCKAITLYDLLLGGPQDTITGLSGADALAVSPDGHTLYVTDNGKHATSGEMPTGRAVTPVNLLTGKVGRPIEVPDDPGTTGPFTVTPVNLRTGRVGHPIAVAQNPNEMAVAPDGHTLYVAGNDNDDGPDSTGPWSLIPIDLATGKVGKPLALHSTPDVLAISPDGRTAYIGNDDDTITTVSTSTDRPGAAIHTGPAFPADYPGPDDIVIAPDGRTLYATDDYQVIVIALS
jgi:DNA-binding beta-propeller fold protein YncE